MQGQNTQKVIEFSYENLQQPPSLDQALIGMMDQSIKSTQWSETYNVVTMMRSINKFFPQFTPNLIGKYSADLLKLISNGKPMIIKNVNCLVHEIFLIGKNINVEKTVETFLPVLIKKAALDFGNHKKMDQAVLTAFCNNCGYDISFESKD